MKNQKTENKSKLPFLFITILLPLVILSCVDKKSISNWTPLSLVSLAVDSESKETLAKCIGNSPFISCPAAVTEFVSQLKQVELLQNGKRIAVANVENVPYVHADCRKYYKIVWENTSSFKSTTLFLNRSKGDVCGISWEKVNGETYTHLIDIPEAKGDLDDFDSIQVNGMTLKFYRSF
ncbi:hypothetical protein [Leptospira jelokensis]|uniref:hypothetical protein n=1 Tax=Leptospira jelokensis TaxID=2484931 RepID=UPI0010912E28|nr:hypothetical protein [Leptospira jelokensis]TGM06278.1 hypothetical protein EHQ79_01730 [Leptospira jelokensis]